MVHHKNPTTEDVAAGLRDLYVVSQRALDRIMRLHGASFARTKLLMFIDQADWVRGIDVVESFGLAPRTVTEAIDGLERDGLVRRDPDPLDRRTKRISITAAGRLVIRNSEPARKAFIDEVFGILEPGETAMFGKALDKLRARVREIDQRSASPSTERGIDEADQPSKA